MAELDPLRDYLPSSPYIPDEANRAGSDAIVPEQHLWGPRDYWKNPFYKANRAVFASEIGYHGMPHAASVRKFIPEAELNDRSSPSWICHASQPDADPDGPFAYRNRLMESQSAFFWGAASEDPDTFMRQSQIVQAEALKYFIELFRAAKWHKTGLIWWNVIDCWPQFSDAVTDYYFVRKLAFYYIRSAQRPLILIVGDPEGTPPKASLTVSNDAPEPAAGSYTVSDLDSGEILARGNYAVEADAAAKIDAFELDPDRRRMLLIRWDNAGKTACSHYLAGKPPFDLTRYLKWLGILDEKIYARLGRNEW